MNYFLGEKQLFETFTEVFGDVRIWHNLCTIHGNRNIMSFLTKRRWYKYANPSAQEYDPIFGKIFQISKILWFCPNFLTASIIDMLKNDPLIAHLPADMINDYFSYLKLKFAHPNTSWYTEILDSKRYIDTTTNFSESFNNKINSYINQATTSDSILMILELIQNLNYSIYATLENDYNTNTNSMHHSETSLKRYQRKLKFCKSLHQKVGSRRITPSLIRSVITLMENFYEE